MSRMMQTPAGLIGISAIFHLVAPFVSGFSSESLILLPVFVLYALLAWFVWRGKRWAAWLSFFFMLFGGIAGMTGFMSPDTMPVWVSLGIWGADWLAAICLFIVLWRDRPALVTPAETSDV